MFDEEVMMRRETGGGRCLVSDGGRLGWADSMRKGSEVAESG